MKVLATVSFFSLFILSGVLQAASFTFSDSNCESFRLDDNGGGSYTLVCVAGGGTGPGAPSGCTASATPSSFASGVTGQPAISMNCTGDVDQNTVYSWTRTGGGSTQQFQNASFTDNLPVNSTASNIIYTYTGRACNETLCTDKTVTVTMQANSGSGGGTDYCPSSGVIRETIPWQAKSWTVALSNQTVYAGAFTVPAAFNGRAGAGNFNISEYTGAPASREVTISPSACDFRAGAIDTTGNNAPMSRKFGSTTISYFNTVNLGTVGATLVPGRTYYLNIRNKTNTGMDSCLGNCTLYATMKLPNSQ